MPSPAYELARCPVCDGAETHIISDEQGMRAEVEALWAFHGERLRPETPPEHLVDRVAFSQQPPLRVVQCAGCGTVFRSPRERAQELAATYEGEAPEEEVLRALLATQQRAYAAQAGRLAEGAPKPGRGLEVGSYVGGFLGAARDVGWQFEGLDVNEHVNEFARRQGFVVARGELVTFEADAPFDAIAIWNCFDQLDEPRRVAIAAHRLLRERGVLAIRVPNGAFYAAVRALLDGSGGAVARALLAHNNLLTFPYRQGFTASSLERLLDETGFTIERRYGDTLVPIADDWTKAWAAIEEKAVKAALRLLARGEADAAPWLEVYARAR